MSFLGLSDGRTIVIFGFTFCIILIILYNVYGKNRKRYLKELKKKDKTLKLFLLELANTPRRFIGGGIKFYEESKDIIVSFAMNYLIIMLVLDLIKKYTITSFISIILSLVLIIHLSYWISWLFWKIGFVREDRNSLFEIMGIFFFIIIGCVITYTISELVGTIMILIAILAMAKMLSELIKNLNIEIKLKEKKIKRSKTSSRRIRR